MDLVAVIIYPVSDFYTTDDSTNTQLKRNAKGNEITFKVKKFMEDLLDYFFQ